MDASNLESLTLVNPENVRRLRLAMETGVSNGDFMPAIYVVEPTSRCNLGCIMCPNSRLGIDKLGDASLSDFESTLREIAPFAELTMLYFMGESTLHPDFLELMKLARRTLKGKVVLSTNAFNLSDEQIDVILDAVDILVIPIDRWNQEAYERIRLRSNFETVVESAERVLSRRGNRQTPVVVVKGLDIHLPRERDRSLLDNEAASFVEYWESRGAHPLAGWLNTWAGQMPNLLKLTIKGSPYERAPRVACADLWFKMVINWQGHVVLCCHNWNYSVQLGDLRTKGVASLWQSALLGDYRSKHTEGDYSVAPICSGCREWAEPDELNAYLRLEHDDLFKVF